MSIMKKTDSRRPYRLDAAPLDYAPENELGVVFLFSNLAKKQFGLRVERVKSSYPDCIAYRGEKKIRLEFEYRSRNFALHRHDPKKCDWLVCWIHDWPACPSSVQVIELRKFYGLGFNVWVVPLAGENAKRISRTERSDLWSVPSQSTKDDIVLYYRSTPDKFIQDIFKIGIPEEVGKPGWKSGRDWMASIRRVASLRTPLHLAELKSHPVLSRAGFVRANVFSRYKVTPHWPELYKMIIDRNPSAAIALKAYGPGKIL